jgi:FtsH ternary system-associated peptide
MLQRLRHPDSRPLGAGGKQSTRGGSVTEYRFAPHLPDLIAPPEYPEDPGGRRVRLRIRAAAEGVEIRGDAARAATLEALLEGLEVEAIEQMLCG